MHLPVLFIESYCVKDTEILISVMKMNIVLINTIFRYRMLYNVALHFLDGASYKDLIDKNDDYDNMI